MEGAFLNVPVVAAEEPEPVKHSLTLRSKPYTIYNAPLDFQLEYVHALETMHFEEDYFPLNERKQLLAKMKRIIAKKRKDSKGEF